MFEWFRRWWFGEEEESFHNMLTMDEIDEILAREEGKPWTPMKKRQDHTCRVAPGAICAICGETRE